MEHPLPRIQDLCPSHALHGAHRALVVYITHVVVPQQRQTLSLPDSGGQGSPDLGWFCLEQPCLGLMVSVHYTVSVPAPRT